MSNADDWCKHYNGLLQMIGHLEFDPDPKCKAGIAYLQFREEGMPAIKTYPCFKSNNMADKCPLAVFPTPEENAEQERQATEALNKFFADIKANVCPRCQTAMIYKKQVGPCIYAAPCGHRLYQGRLTKTEKAHAKVARETIDKEGNGQ